MLNAFPQVQTADKRALLLSYDEDLRGISDQAIVETAQRYRSGGIPDQNDTFAPSIAQFRSAAIRQMDIIAVRDRPRLPAPKQHSWEPQPKEHRVRMGFKMTMLSAGFSRREVEKVKQANDAGLDELIALAQTWGVPVPEELWAERTAA